MSSVPSLEMPLPGMLSRAESSTVPIREDRSPSSSRKVNRDGTVGTISTPSGSSVPRNWALLPPAQSTSLSQQSLSPSLAWSVNPPSRKASMRVILTPQRNSTPSFAMSRSRQLTICIASCEHGNTQPSSWVVNRIPSLSNQARVSRGGQDFSRRFITL